MFALQILNYKTELYNKTKVNKLLSDLILSNSHDNTGIDNLFNTTESCLSDMSGSCADLLSIKKLSRVLVWMDLVFPYF